MTKTTREVETMHAVTDLDVLPCFLIGNIYSLETTSVTSLVTIKLAFWTEDLDL